MPPILEQRLRDLPDPAFGYQDERELTAPLTPEQRVAVAEPLGSRFSNVGHRGLSIRSDLHDNHVGHHDRSSRTLATRNGRKIAGRVERSRYRGWSLYSRRDGAFSVDESLVAVQFSDDVVEHGFGFQPAMPVLPR